jgi:hypothetical protein
MLESVFEQYRTMKLAEIYEEIERIEHDESIDLEEKRSRWQELNSILNCRQANEDMDRPC